MGGGEEVIELSVEETNALRLKLGLAPLRLTKTTTSQEDDEEEGLISEQQKQQSGSNEQQEEVLELSVNETNELRKKLGLAPLKDTSTKIIHKPAENEGEVKEAAQRIERAKLKDEVEQGILQVFNAKSLGEEEKASANDAFEWASKMRKNKKKSSTTANREKKDESSDNKDIQSASGEGSSYHEDDLKGMKVSHAMSEIEAGKTTILTLTDAPILKTIDETSKKPIDLNEDSEMLENVELTETKTQRDGLRKKRQMELGMGRAGGYAGFDDDEFEELGGTQSAKGVTIGDTKSNKKNKKDKDFRGFQIGADFDELDNQASDLFASEAGKAISLLPETKDVTASDFMTEEEDLEIQQQLKKKKKKDTTKFNKKKKKKSKDKKKKRKQYVGESDDDDDAEVGDEDPQKETSSKKSLLQELEESAPAEGASKLRKKRDRSAGGEDDDADGDKKVAVKVEEYSHTKAAYNVNKEQEAKRLKYDAIMAKGNARSNEAFKAEKDSPLKTMEVEDNDEEPDDAFLNAALAKARRLNRLRKMNGAGGTIGNATKSADADAMVLEAVKSTMGLVENRNATSGGVTFAVDDTREFTRALRARAEQAERSNRNRRPTDRNTKQPIKAEGATVNVKMEDSLPESAAAADAAASSIAVKEEEGGVEDMQELAKHIEDDTEDIAADGLFDGATGNTVPVGRGLSTVLSMLKQTGEITRKNAGKEEMRGRAKDERTYEDYEPLDLSKVVKIGENATEKDKEFARREIKLEYRDKSGRLLTRKEAFRDLCYQFHGYGSSKRKEEKRQQQIAREQAEARLASRHLAEEGAAAGTFGALKATQKATGKAFVIHKT